MGKKLVSIGTINSVLRIDPSQTVKICGDTNVANKVVDCQGFEPRTN